MDKKFVCNPFNNVEGNLSICFELKCGGTIRIVQNPSLPEI